MTTVRASHALPQPDESAKRPNLEVVRRPGRRRARRTKSGLVGTTLVIGLFGAVFAVVVLQVLLVQSQSRLDALNARVDREQTTAKQLRDRITGLESPERVAASARDRLGMIPADVAYLQPSPEDDARATYDPSEAPVTTTTAPPVTASTARPSATTAATGATKGSSSSATSKASTATTRATSATTKATTATSSSGRSGAATTKRSSTATTTRSGGSGAATGATR